jgi:hypothetical protein
MVFHFIVDVAVVFDVVIVGALALGVMFLYCVVCKGCFGPLKNCKLPLKQVL